jgi:alpha-beta hydrolase superfamily lysophospholipase
MKTSLLIIVLIITLNLTGASYDVYSQDFQQNNYEVYYPLNTDTTAICMLIHGLNLKPSKMDWICKQLLNQGAIVINVELWGHGNNPINSIDSFIVEKKMDQFKNVTWEKWMQDTKPALDYIDLINKNKNLPEYLFGFSLGGLVGASIENEFDYSFDKYFLFAPALEIKFLPRILIRLFGLFPKMVIESRAPEIYRDNSGTPIAAYKALFNGIKRFKKENQNLDNCYIIIDKKDELVSSKKLKKLANSNNFKINIIERKNTDCKYCNYKHLIIDDNSLGSKSDLVVKQIKSFF